jgi:hypothetical protein
MTLVARTVNDGVVRAWDGCSRGSRLLAAIYRGAVLAWSGDPTHPVSTADQLADLLPNAQLHVADDLAGIRSWTGLIYEFLDG